MSERERERVSYFYIVNNQNLLDYFNCHLNEEETTCIYFKKRNYGFIGYGKKY